MFSTLVSQPLYNGLIGLLGLMPFFDAGVIVIIFTIIIKFILLPLSVKASKAQLQMKSAEKDLNDIKEKYKDNKEDQAKKTIDYYRQKGINPFSSIFILLIQLPIIIGLYQVFLKSGLPNIDMNMLYEFVKTLAPTSPPDMMFLGLIDIATKSLSLAIVAGITPYFQMHIATSSPTPNQPSKGKMQMDIAKAMSVQMKYFFPILVTFISYSISAALALYWITSNVFAIIQELYIKKKYHKTTIVV